MNRFKIVIVAIGIVGGLIVLAFCAELGGLKWKIFFAPKHEAVRRQVFKETRSFNEGKIQDLAKYRLEYLRAKDEDEKMAIVSTIRIQFADYDYSKLNPELESFLKEVLY